MKETTIQFLENEIFDGAWKGLVIWTSESNIIVLTDCFISEHTSCFIFDRYCIFGIRSSFDRIKSLKHKQCSSNAASPSKALLMCI